MSSTRAGTVLALLLLAGCREASAPPFNARASLTSCNVIGDCTQPPAGGCFTVQCTGHVCTPTGGACAACVLSSDCNDANPCTNDSCVLSACVNTLAPGAGCCVTVLDCAPANACQSASCAQSSCTYVSNGGAGCCNVNADCLGGALCNGNTCTCGGGGRYCPGLGCVPAGGCCAAAECDSTHSTGASCTAGVCSYTGCSGGFGDCDTTGANLAGCETNLATSAAHCGACVRACSGSGVSGAPTCAAGLCTSSCTAGLGNCTHPAAPTADDGCETNLANSTANCGACARACSPANVATLACSAGTCTSTCTAGFGNCAQPTAPNPDDGCETNTNTSLSNCGACGRGCSSTGVSTQSCSGGLCTSTCNAGLGNCVTPAAPTADDGCETNVDGSIANCGACGRACSATGVATLICSVGHCASTCVAGRGNCALPTAPSADDGCEVNLNSSAANCGACGRPCSASGVSGAPTCASGLCTSSCTAGLGNCTHPAAPTADDGCETDVMLSASNCGGCGRACSATNTAAVTCGGGLCTSSCAAGFGNCSRPAFPTADNGCEANVSNDVSNCGGCAIACPAPTNSCQVTSCASQACGYVSTGGAGCCSTIAQCTPNVCQNASCTANRCVYTGKVGVAGCCGVVGDCPAQTDPCKSNTCLNNVCGTMATACGDGGVDMTVEDLAPPADLSEDLAPADLSAPDLAVPTDGASDLAGLSLTGGGGCAFGGEGAGAGALLLVVLLLALRRRHA